MGRSAESFQSESLGAQSGRRTADGVPARLGLDHGQNVAHALFGAVGLGGRSDVDKIKPELVTDRLDHFVAPAAQPEPMDAPDLEWVQQHNRSVRQSLKGSKDITKRLNGEPEEKPAFQPKERVMKGAALYMKMLEQRLAERSKRNAPVEEQE